MTFAKKLRLVINQRGVTVGEFSHLTGVPVGSLKSYLDGTSKPGMDNLVSIAHRCDMGVDWLLQGVDAFEMKL